MKIGIFETEHFECAYPVIKLFDNNQNDITVFCYQESFEQFKYLFPGEPKCYLWRVKPWNRSKYRFILDMYREIKKSKIDLVYLDTISNNFIVYALFVFLLRKKRIVLTIHNINTQFEFKRSLSPRRIVRFIGRKMLMAVVKEFNVIAMTMVEQLSVKIPNNKKIHCVPGAIFEEERTRQTSPPIHDEVSIVVPGTIDGRRRDYEQALELVRLLDQMNIKVTMTFLGRFFGDYGQQLLEKIKALNLSNVNLRYYDNEIVAQPEFDHVMNKAHLVYIPSVLSTILEDGVTERYGETISSGNLFDVVKYAKPFIIPDELQVDPYLENSCRRYGNVGQIADLVLAFHNRPVTYNNLQQEALKSSLHYTIGKVRERNASLFNS